MSNIDTIRAYAAFHPREKFAPFEFQWGALAPDEVEIQVETCGICHSDLSVLDNEWGNSTYPFVPGHEVIGRVVAKGAMAKGVELGDRVGIGWQAGCCRACRSCLSGDQNLCEASEATIIGRYGGFAERVRCQWEFAIPLPEGVDAATAGPLFCGGIR